MKRQIIALAIIVSAIFPITAQPRRTPPVKSTPITKPAPVRCAGGWRGVISFRKTLVDSLESDEPGIRKSIDRIQHKTSRNYDYSARAIIDGKQPESPQVSTRIDFTDSDKNWGLEKVFDSCGSREAGHWFIVEGTDDRMTTAQASGPARSFNLSVDELGGFYSFSLQFSDANGVYKREEHVRRSGHCQAKNNEPFDRSTNQPTKVDGESFSITGEKVNPESPDTLIGSKMWGGGTGEVKGFIYEVSWRFTRCPAQLVITELRLQHPKFPQFENWQDIPETIGTIDGNRIKVIARVLNMSGETKFADLKISETYKGDQWNGSRPDEPLPDGEVGLRLEGGEEREIELVWDSEGQAWFDDGRPHLLHRVKAELSENGQKKDEKEKRVNIAPKPLVLVNGVWGDHSIWDPIYQNLMSATHSYQWKAYPVGKDNRLPLGSGNAFLSGSPSVSIYENADRLANYVNFVREDANAWHVDMVGHSTGGLIARLYLHKSMPAVPDARPAVKHLMMLGTPNDGIRCADVFAGKLNMFKDALQPVREFTQDEMTRFNKFVVNTGGTRVSALVGNSVPIICGGFNWNDGFVTVESARHGVADFAYSNDLSGQLVDGKNFGSFVRPHVVTGPNGAYPLPVRSDPNDIDRWKINSFAASEFGFRNASYSPGEPVPGASATIDGEMTEFKLAPRETKIVDVPVVAGPNLGFTFIASHGVSASLIDRNGTIVARNDAGDALARSVFRLLYFRSPVPAGTWKIRVENRSDTEAVFAGYPWQSATPVQPVAD